MERLNGMLESTADQQSFLRNLRREMNDFFEDLASCLKDDRDLARDILREKEGLDEEMGDLQRELDRAAQREDDEKGKADRRDKNGDGMPAMRGHSAAVRSRQSANKQGER